MPAAHKQQKQQKQHEEEEDEQKEDEEEDEQKDEQKEDEQKEDEQKEDEQEDEQKDEQKEDEQTWFTTSVFGKRLRLPHYVYKHPSIDTNPRNDQDSYEQLVIWYTLILDGLDYNRYVIYLSWLTDIQHHFEGDKTELARREQEFFDAVKQRDHLSKKKSSLLGHRMLLAWQLLKQQQLRLKLINRGITLLMLTDVSAEVLSSQWQMNRLLLLLDINGLKDCEGETTSKQVIWLAKQVAAQHKVFDWRWSDDGLEVQILEFHDGATVDEEYKKDVLAWKPCWWVADSWGPNDANWGKKVDDFQKEQLKKTKVVSMEEDDEVEGMWHVVFSDGTELEMKEEWLMNVTRTLIRNGQRATVDPQWTEKLYEAKGEDPPSQVAQQQPQQPVAQQLPQQPVAQQPVAQQQLLQQMCERLQREIADLEQQLQQQKEAVRALQRQDQTTVSSLKQLVRKRVWTTEETALIDQLLAKRLKKLPDVEKRRSLMADLNLPEVDEVDDEKDEEEPLSTAAERRARCLASGREAVRRWYDAKYDYEDAPMLRAGGFDRSPSPPARMQLVDQKQVRTESLDERQAMVDQFVTSVRNKAKRVSEIMEDPSEGARVKRVKVESEVNTDQKEEA